MHVACITLQLAFFTQRLILNGESDKPVLLHLYRLFSATDKTVSYPLHGTPTPPTTPPPLPLPVPNWGEKCSPNSVTSLVIFGHRFAELCGREVGGGGAETDYASDIYTTPKRMVESLVSYVIYM